MTLLGGPKLTAVLDLLDEWIEKSLTVFPRADSFRTSYEKGGYHVEISITKAAQPEGDSRE